MEQAIRPRPLTLVATAREGRKVDEAAEVRRLLLETRKFLRERCEDLDAIERGGVYSRVMRTWIEFLDSALKFAARAAPSREG